MICPICRTSIRNSKHIWKYEFSEIIQCNFCGLVHHVRNSALYKEQVFATYRKNSWGHFMPCYFGGKKINTPQKLFSPNSLINIFFLEAHYREFLEKNFEILSSQEYLEKYGKGLSVEKSYNYVLKKKCFAYDESAIINKDFKEKYDIAIQTLFADNNQERV